MDNEKLSREVSTVMDVFSKRMEKVPHNILAATLSTYVMLVSTSKSGGMKLPDSLLSFHEHAVQVLNLYIELDEKMKKAN